MFKGLTNEEVFEMWQNGNEQARDYLVEKNMKLVYMIANKYRNRHNDDFENLIQEGSIGLIKSIHGFKPEYGFKFTTYATTFIQGAMQRYLRDYQEDKPYKVKRRDRALYRKIQIAKEELEHKKVRKVSTKDISGMLDVGIIEIEEVLNIFSYHKSMEGTIHENKDRKDSDITQAEQLADNNNLSEEQLIEKINLRDKLQKLQDELRKVIELRYFRDLTQSECGQVLNITQVTVSRREKRALQELKKII